MPDFTARRDLGQLGAKLCGASIPKSWLRANGGIEYLCHECLPDLTEYVQQLRLDVDSLADARVGEIIGKVLNLVEAVVAPKPQNPKTPKPLKHSLILAQKNSQIIFYIDIN